MKILPAQRAKVTMPSLSGLAAMVLAFIPHHAPVTPAAPDIGRAAAPAVPAAVQVARFKALVASIRHRSDAALPMYTVKSGDTLSGIATSRCTGKADDWTGIYAASRLHGNANIIQPGQVLELDCAYLPAELGKATTPRSSTSVTSANTMAVVQSPSSGDATARHDPFDGHHGDCGDGDGDGLDASCSVIFPTSSGGYHAVTVTQAPVSQASVNVSGYSGIQACIVSRESGGQSQVMNASGHYGLYQFDLGTWESGGGSASDFGHASVAEQNAVFQSVYAARGAEPWAPSDGC